jgi:hypothetical protein
MAQTPMDQPASPVQLRQLRAVQDVREKRTPWQQAAQEAASRVKDPKLREQVSQRLSNIAQQASWDLLARPGQTAVATVAVFTNPKTEEQRVAAVSYEGLGDSINPTFFPRLLANIPATQPAGDNKLMLDPIATSYLCFYLDHADLMAGDVPHATMKKSLDLAIQFARDQGAQLASGSASSQSSAQVQARQRANQQAQAAQQQQQAAVESSSPAYDESSVMSMLPGYYSNYYSGQYGYWQPWLAYLPGAGAGPVVVTAQSSQPGQKNDKHTHLGPNVPAQRDPKTGQPLPPPVVTDSKTNGQTNPQGQAGGTGTPAPSAPVQNAPTANHQTAPAPNHQVAPAPNHQTAPAPNHQVAPTPPVQHPAPPPPQREAPPQEQPAQRSAPPAPARGGSEPPARK